MIANKKEFKRKKRVKAQKKKAQKLFLDKLSLAKRPPFISSEKDLLPSNKALRLSKVARMLDKGIHEIVCYLEENGFQIEASPNFKINAEHIDVLNNSKKEKDITDACVIDYTWKLLEDLRIDYNVIFSLTPEQFENLVAEFLVQSGFKVKLNGETYRKDGGIDLIAWKKDIVTIVIAIQVKFKHDFSKKVTSGEVRDFQGALSINDYFNAGMVVTNTDFTVDSRWIEEQIRLKLELKSSKDLKCWLKGNFLSKKEMNLDLNLGKDVYFKEKLK